MPAYNAAAHIGRSIQSALTQRDVDLELLVVNDGSTDGTEQVAQQFAAADGRVRVLRQLNSGQSAARNHAMRVARGEIFALLDSDDEWDPSFLKNQLSVLRAFPLIGIVTSNAINRGGQLDGRPYWPAVEGSRRLSLIDLIEEEDAVCIMSVFRREVFDTIGGFDESLRVNEDYDWWLKAAQRGFGFMQTRKPLCYYRRRPDSCSADELRMLAGISTVLSAFRRREDCSAVVAKAIDRQLDRYARRQLAVKAKAALEGHDFTAAAVLFRRLYEQQGGVRLRLVTAGCRWTPRLLLRVDAYVQRRRDRATGRARPMA
jgi:glycosyltransferase involved in cell wall biosynthesis